MAMEADAFATNVLMAWDMKQQGEPKQWAVMRGNADNVPMVYAFLDEVAKDNPDLWRYEIDLRHAKTGSMTASMAKLDSEPYPGKIKPETLIRATQASYRTWLQEGSVHNNIYKAYYQLSRNIDCQAVFDDKFPNRIGGIPGLTQDYVTPDMTRAVQRTVLNGGKCPGRKP